MLLKKYEKKGKMKKSGLAKTINDFMLKHIGIVWIVLSNMFSGTLLSISFIALTWVVDNFSSCIGYKSDDLDAFYSLFSKIGSITILSVFIIYGIVSFVIQLVWKTKEINEKSKIDYKNECRYYQGNYDGLTPAEANITKNANNSVMKADIIELVDDEEEGDDDEN